MYQHYQSLTSSIKSTEPMASTKPSITNGKPPNANRARQRHPLPPGHHNLPPHHYIPTFVTISCLIITFLLLIGLLRITSIISFTLLQWYFHTSLHNATWPNQHSTLSLAPSASSHALHIWLVTLVKCSQFFVTIIRYNERTPNTTTNS